MQGKGRAAKDDPLPKRPRKLERLVCAVHAQPPCAGPRRQERGHVGGASAEKHLAFQVLRCGRLPVVPVAKQGKVAKPLVAACGHENDAASGGGKPFLYHVDGHHGWCLLLPAACGPPRPRPHPRPRARRSVSGPCRHERAVAPRAAPARFLIRVPDENAPRA